VTDTSKPEWWFWVNHCFKSKSPTVTIMSQLW